MLPFSLIVLIAIPMCSGSFNCGIIPYMEGFWFGNSKHSKKTVAI
jgi:hypothetical protein